MNSDPVAYGDDGALVVTRDGVLHKLSLSSTGRLTDTSLKVLDGCVAAPTVTGTTAVVVGGTGDQGSTTTLALVDLSSMPTVVLAALAAAGRVLFAAVPDVKPVSAIAIVAGATLGPQSGFAVGALSALVSNFFFGQGVWTPWQMYAWGLVGYVAGFVCRGEGRRARVGVYVWGLCSALVYGAILNGFYVIGFVRPLTWQTAFVALLAALPFDLIHGVSTVGFLLLVWTPWRASIRRVVAKYGLSPSEGARETRGG